MDLSTAFGLEKPTFIPVKVLSSPAGSTSCIVTEDRWVLPGPVPASFSVKSSLMFLKWVFPVFSRVISVMKPSVPKLAPSNSQFFMKITFSAPADEALPDSSAPVTIASESSRSEFISPIFRLEKVFWLPAGSSSGIFP